ncbi:hypothetical protein CLCR_03209 [Cladophialophora carrionii]|uniref:Uncharacterized protein n=1 Tax=Cladophialophora carrionii TaxID=86049 RepID=A0A1C1D1S1_9EURO|nr:hypothetical protein CLCR_03209 [Cladophialophora carrionii]
MVMVKGSGRFECIVETDCVVVKQIPTEKGYVSHARYASYHSVPENFVIVVWMALAPYVEKAFLAMLRLINSHRCEIPWIFSEILNTVSGSSSLGLD